MFEASKTTILQKVLCVVLCLGLVLSMCLGVSSGAFADVVKKETAAESTQKTDGGSTGSTESGTSDTQGSTDNTGASANVSSTEAAALGSSGASGNDTGLNKQWITNGKWSKEHPNTTAWSKNGKLSAANVKIWINPEFEYQPGHESDFNNYHDLQLDPTGCDNRPAVRVKKSMGWEEGQTSYRRYTSTQDGLPVMTLDFDNQITDMNGKSADCRVDFYDISFFSYDNDNNNGWTLIFHFFGDSAINSTLQFEGSAHFGFGTPESLTSYNKIRTTVNIDTSIWDVKDNEGKEHTYTKPYKTDGYNTSIFQTFEDIDQRAESDDRSETGGFIGSPLVCIDKTNQGSSPKQTVINKDATGSEEAYTYLQAKTDSQVCGADSCRISGKFNVTDGTSLTHVKSHFNAGLAAATEVNIYGYGYPVDSLTDPIKSVDKTEVQPGDEVTYTIEQWLPYTLSTRSENTLQDLYIFDGAFKTNSVFDRASLEDQSTFKTLINNVFTEKLVSQYGADKINVTDGVSTTNEKWGSFFNGGNVLTFNPTSDTVKNVGGTHFYTIKAKIKCRNDLEKLGYVFGSNVANQATTAYTLPSGEEKTATSNTVNIKVIAPNLSITKTIDKAKAMPGDSVNYTITGKVADAEARSIVIEDQVPNSLEVVGTPTSSVGSVKVEGNKVVAGTIDSANPVNLVKDGEIKVTIPCKVKADAASGKVDNTASISCTNDGPKEATASLEIGKPVLSINKDSDVKSVRTGDRFNYLIEVGVSDSNATNLIVEDEIPTDLKINGDVKSTIKTAAGSTVGGVVSVEGNKIKVALDSLQKDTEKLCIEVPVLVNADRSGTITNTAKCSADYADPKQDSVDVSISEIVPTFANSNNFLPLLFVIIALALIAAGVIIYKKRKGFNN